MKEAFNSFDTEKKGWFGVDDLKGSLIDPDFSYNKEEFQQIFEEAFPGGKDKITFADFKAWMEHLAT